MILQTKTEIAKPTQLIDFQSKILMIGSCFAENIGQILQTYKFSTIINPCGIAYNPASISKSIDLVITPNHLNESDFIFHNNLWNSLHHHGRFSHTNKNILLKNIEKELVATRENINEFSHIFFTLGTAWVFEHKETQQIVNNCHKIPANAFNRKRLSITESITVLGTAIKQIRQQNPKVTIIFTVSPVRHLKDGLHENQLSKATLLLAISALQEQYENIGYFPAYEIAADELRDYRFFGEDLCHLNNLGVQYIWERFAENYIKTESRVHFPALQKLQKALNHKVQNIHLEASKQFKKKIAVQITELERKLPYVDFSQEKSLISSTNST